MTLVESVDPVLLTKEDNSIQHFIWVISLFYLHIFLKIQFSQYKLWFIKIKMKTNIPVHYQKGKHITEG
jgi:hypothetical protein